MNIEITRKTCDDNITMSEHYKFFQNRQCEYFPCHKGIPEEDFNCPHHRNNYDKITGRFQDIAAVMAKANKEADSHEM